VSVGGGGGGCCDLTLVLRSDLSSRKSTPSPKRHKGQSRRRCERKHWHKGRKNEALVLGLQKGLNTKKRKKKKRGAIDGLGGGGGGGGKQHHQNQHKEDRLRGGGGGGGWGGGGV